MNDATTIDNALTTILSSLERISLECRQAIAQLPIREYDHLVRSLADIRDAYEALDAQFPQQHSTPTDCCPPNGIQRPTVTFGDPDVLTIEQVAAHNKLWGSK